MPREVLQHLQLEAGQTVIDGTVGAGGHSEQILKRIGDSGHLVGFDRDTMMLGFAGQRLGVPCSNVNLVHASYSEAEEELSKLQIESVDRVLLDLGLSSDQLEDRNRGFGFDAGGDLDMRFDTSTGIPARELLASADESELTRIFDEFGEEPAAARIARTIVQERKTGTVSTAEELEAIVRTATKSTGAGGRKVPSRIFQALRIAVNKELEHVQNMMTDVLPNILSPGGIAVILTFHSLEDRIVKTAFKGKKQWQVLTKKPVESTPAEVRINPRSRSAKLRAAKLVKS